MADIKKSIKNVIKLALPIVCICLIFIYYDNIYYSIKQYIVKDVIKSHPTKVNLDNTQNINTVSENEVEEKLFPKNITTNVTSVKINPLMDFNYKTKFEIYNIRKQFVNDSLFHSKKYHPNENVFGQIVSGMPWVSIIFQNFETDRLNPHLGLSEESRFINNPSGLVMIDMEADLMVGDRRVSVMDIVAKNTNNIKNSMALLPSSIKYIKSRNTIVIKYNIGTFFNSLKETIKLNREYYKIFCLECLNARDFGYKYIFASDFSNVSFYDNSVKDMACEIKTCIAYVMHENETNGVNNAILDQQELYFSITSLPASINLKLWKKKPGDIYVDKSSVNVELLLLE